VRVVVLVAAVHDSEALGLPGTRPSRHLAYITHVDPGTGISPPYCLDNPRSKERSASFSVGVVSLIGRGWWKALDMSA
jgi:hypothetical protein